MAWALIVLIILASMAGLNAIVSSPDEVLRNMAWEGVVNPRHDPVAARAVEDIDDDAR